MQDLTGRGAEDLACLAECYAALPAARRTTGSVLRAWADFLRTPIMPAYDLERIDRELGAAPRPGSRSALDDAGWRTSHRVGPALHADG